MAKFCTRCGKQCEDSAMICPSCGQQLSSGSSLHYDTNGNNLDGMSLQMNVNQQDNLNGVMHAGGNNSSGNMFTVKNIIRLLAILLEIICFLPTFVVSCGNRSENVNVVMGITGYKDISGMGMDTDGSVWLLVLIAIPAVLFAIWFFNNVLTEKSMTIIAMALTVSDLVLWNVFKSNVSTVASEMQCEFQTTMWFTLNLILLFILLVIFILLIAKKAILDKPLIS